MKKYILIALLFMTATAQAIEPILYDDAKLMGRKVIINIVTDNSYTPPKQFVRYFWKLRMTATAAPITYCFAQEIIDPPGTWDDMPDSSIMSVFMQYLRLPNGIPAADTSGWCDWPR